VTSSSLGTRCALAAYRRGENFCDVLDILVRGSIKLQTAETYLHGAAVSQRHADGVRLQLIEHRRIPDIVRIDIVKRDG
jgi:bifunctional pyridoxal-dependent enzyme with beta-cystathionase and maltose regulon repressor activities